MKHKAWVAYFVLGTLLLTLACQVSNLLPGASGGGEEPVDSALGCPTEPTQMQVAVSHSFNWSQNRDVENFLIEGSTQAGAFCLITVTGNQVTAEPCQVGFSNAGFYTTTDAGKCELTGNSAAVVTISGSCQDGLVTLLIKEVADAEALTGLLTCSGLLGTAYHTYYPNSSGTYSFTLDRNGTTVTDEVAVDPSNMFAYTKRWTLTPP